MPNNNNILQNYFAALNKHFDAVSNFNRKTKDVLASSLLVNLVCEDLGMQVVTEMLGKNKSTSVEKLLAIIENIELDSKTYLSRLQIYIVLLEKLIRLVIKVAE